MLNLAKKNFYNKTGKTNNDLNDLKISKVINKVKRLEGNQNCCDCGHEDADWLVTNLGVIVCIYCCGVHRDLGVHVSKTQSISIDRLASTQLIVRSFEIQEIGALI